MQARHILIATGAKAHKLPIEGAEHSIISDQVLDLPEKPKKMAIVGGGYIAVEFAGIFNNYGTDVHLVYRQVPDFLPKSSWSSDIRGTPLHEVWQSIYVWSPSNGYQAVWASSASSLAPGLTPGLNRSLISKSVLCLMTIPKHGSYCYSTDYLDLQEPILHLKALKKLMCLYDLDTIGCCCSLSHCEVSMRSADSTSQSSMRARGSTCIQNATRKRLSKTKTEL